VADPAEAFETVADLLPEPMLLVRADGAVASGNTAFASTFGHSKPDLPGRILADLTIAGEQPLADYLRRCASTRQLLFNALTLRAASGAEVPCRCEGAVFTPATAHARALVVLRFVPKEQSVSRFVALAQKIAELSAEISRRQQVEQQLVQQRELLEVTLESIGDAVITTDTSGAVTFMNRVAEALTGWTFLEASGRLISGIFTVINEETRAPVVSSAAKVLVSRQVVGSGSRALLIARDGIERPVDDSGAPILGADGRLYGAVLVFRDMTDVRRTEHEQRAARRAAESANHAKDHFLATLSHELRTPLNAILGWSRMLSRSPAEAERERLRHGLNVIERNGQVLARLVEDLLDVSRITAGKLQLHYEAINLFEVVQTALDTIRPAANGKDLRVAVEGGEPLPVIGDAQRLQQVIWNLLMNAVKFTPAGGSIEIEAAASDSVVQLCVRDTGQGFTPEFKTLMFDAFSQADASFSRPHGGLGLGLTISRRLVEAHGGTIHAHSPGVGEGATFVVTLPRAREHPGPSAPPG
jgi:PAS domain S-box-containing protein